MSDEAKGSGATAPEIPPESREPKPASAPAPRAPLKVRLREKYVLEAVPKLLEKFQLRNKMSVPKLKKICLNIGFGKAATENNPKFMEQCVAAMTTICGQKAVITRSRKSISNFKLREGMQVGCRVTLRGTIMYEFFDRLVNVAIPRIRDFRGISPRSFDGRGNFSMGLQEQTVFPEVEVDKVDHIHGMARRLGIAHTHCVVFEDAPLGVEAARRAGMPAVALTTTLPAEAFAGFDNLLAVVADFEGLPWPDILVSPITKGVTR